MKPIRSIIAESSLTQEAIAREANVSVSLVQKLASGSRQDLRVSTYQAISEAVARLKSAPKAAA